MNDSCAATRVDPAAGSPRQVDLDPATSALRPGVRENAASNARRRLAAMAYAAMGDRERAWELAAMMNPVNTRERPKAWPRTRWNRMWSPPTSTRWRRTPAAAAGAGTRLGRMDVPAPRRIAARVTLEKDRCASRRAFRDWTDSRCATATARPRTTSPSGRRRGCRRGAPLICVSADGVVQADGAVHLVDDRAAHQVLSRCTTRTCATAPTSLARSSNLPSWPRFIARPETNQRVSTP